MAHIGLPLLGDGLHGGDLAAAAASRLCLHAAELRLRHPTSGEELRLRSEPSFPVPRTLVD